MIEQATVKLPHTDRDTNPPVSIHLVHLSSCFVPPFTVASLATSITSCPETRPTPVTIPAAGTRPSYIPKAARGESSRKAVPGSSRRSILWRTGSLPRSLCRLWAFSPPPRRATAERSRSSSISPSNRPALSAKASLFVSTRVLSFVISPHPLASGHHVIRRPSYALVIVISGLERFGNASAPTSGTNPDILFEQLRDPPDIPSLPA